MKLLYTSTLLFLVISFSYCQSPNTKVINGIPVINESISVDDFQKKMSEKQNAQLIDVRTPQEYAQGHLKNARNIDYNGSDFENQLNSLDKSKPVLVYCLSGGRSSSAASVMNKKGFMEVYNMTGGYLNWTNSGKPTETVSAPQTSAGMSLEEFNKTVQSENYVLVDFNATWCAPCKKLSPVLDELAEEKKDHLRLVKIDIDQNKELTKIKQIDNIPRLELYYKGKLIWTEEGYVDKAYILKETKL